MRWYRSPSHTPLPLLGAPRGCFAKGAGVRANKSGSPGLGAACGHDEPNLSRPERFLHSWGWGRVQFHWRRLYLISHLFESLFDDPSSFWINFNLMIFPCISTFAPLWISTSPRISTVAFLPNVTFAPLLMVSVGSSVSTSNRLPQCARRTRLVPASLKSVESHWVHS